MPRLPYRTLAALLLYASSLCAGCGSQEQEAPKDPVESRSAAEFRSDRVAEVLDAATEVIRTRGFAIEGDEWRGFLVDQGSQVDEVSLEGEGCYVMIGAGSSALRELDVRVFDSDGTEVAHDGMTGPRAAVRYCPPHSGTYYVAALATAGTGLFGMRRFAGPSGLDVRLDDLFRGAPVRAEAAGPERP